MKSQFFPNKVFWWLDLATRLSREFKPRANGLASLGLLSCSVIVGATLQLLACLARVLHSGGLQAVSHPRDLAASPCFFAQSWAILHTPSHTTLHDSHLNKGLLIAKIQANLARNKANKMVDKIQPYNNIHAFHDRLFLLFLWKKKREGRKNVFCSIYLGYVIKVGHFIFT